MHQQENKFTLDLGSLKEFSVELMSQETRGNILAVSCDGLITMLLESCKGTLSLLNSNMQQKWTAAILEFFQSVKIPTVPFYKADHLNAPSVDVPVA